MLKRKMHLGASPTIFRNAYKLRKNPTEAEEILWQYLRNRQMEGVRFRRQHPLQKFVADFYAHQYKLVIEVDGDYHNEKVQSFYDHDRDENLSNYSLTILRFTNDEVKRSIEYVLSVIRETIVTLRKSSK